MSVPDAAVSFLLENLSQILVSNYHLIADARENIVKLQGELRTLKRLMTDFSKYNQDSDYLKDTVNEIRTILDEAEDAVDTYVLQAAVQNSRKWVSKTWHQLTDYPVLLRDVGKQIGVIGEKVKKINDDKVKNGIGVLQVQAINNLNRSGQPAEAPEVEEDHVIGFDEPAKHLQTLLTKGSEHLEVISIVGMLGLGKTTLAKKVYKDPNVDYEYMIRAFVYVSQEYDKKEVLLQILNGFTKSNEEVTKMNEQQLEKHICEQLDGKQYLVVLDDVWETKDWDRFKDESRQLLRWRVFHKNDCPEELLEYEVQIARKCDGLPLAVVVIAGIIVNHPDRVDWWKGVASSVKDYIARDTTETTKLIDLMYKHLPNYLKACFLYLGVFREDFEIPVWKLVRLWISEGFIQQEGEINLEDTAEQYLEELIHRNLVMIGQRRSNDKIKTCRVHDTLREFCKREATEQNLFQEIKRNKVFSSKNLLLDQYRRICINNANILEYISGKPSGKRVRSFLTFVKEETEVEPKLVSRLPNTFKLLRVLETESLIFTRFPNELCYLILLKYVAISSNFTSIPSGFSTLWNLQTLIVSTSSATLEIKADIWEMPQFRHLHTNASASLPGPSTKSQKSSETASSGNNVQTLSTISPQSCKKEIFDRTPKLKKLGIRGTLAKHFEVRGGCISLPHLCRLESLENLKLLNDDTNYKLYGLPLKNEFPRQLTKLTLLNTLLQWTEMSTLGQLENLEILKLKEHAFQGELWKPEKGGFRRLKHLYIGHTDLVAWEVASVDHFPKLKSLELNSCDKLQAVPRGLEDISTLQLMVLHCTNPQVAYSARKLQVLKLEEAQKSNKLSIFKLSVYPPEH